MRIINRTPQALWFVSPEFFRYAAVSPFDRRALDLTKGGVLTPPQGEILLDLTTPDPGQMP